MKQSKLAIYCRRSNNNHDKNSQSIETQKEQGIKFANKHNLAYEFFIDEGISGTKENIEDRPGFSEMLSMIENKEINKVYCIDQSRIERNNKIWNLFAGILIQSGCKYYPGGTQFDLEDETNTFIAGVLSQANQLYAQQTSKKVKLANERNAQKGKTHGLVAYGYKRGNDGKYEINEEEAEIVRRIYRLSLEGNGSYTIANILNAEKIPTKFNKYKGEIKRIDKYTGLVTKYKKENIKWRGSVILDMIKNPIYKGIRTWKSNKIQLNVNIISEEEWKAVNDNLDKNKKKVGRREEYRYLLNGLVFCSSCGKEYRGKKRLKGRDNAYKCTGKRYPNTECKNRALSIPKLENFVIHHLFQSKKLENILTSIPDEKETKKLNLDIILTNKKKELKKLQKKIDNATDLLIDKGLEKNEKILEFIKKGEPKVKSLEEDISILEKKIIDIKENTLQNRAQLIIKNTSLNDSFEKLKKAVHMLVQRIEIYHENKDKGGVYQVKIYYKGFDDSSTFLTDWTALKWIWSSYYRKKAITEEDLIEDKEHIEALYALKGILVNDKDLEKVKEEYNLSDEEISKQDQRSESFEGLETKAGPLETIYLNKDSLYIF